MLKITVAQGGTSKGFYIIKMILMILVAYLCEVDARDMPRCQDER